MKRPPVFSQSGGSCLSTIVLTISLTAILDPRAFGMFGFSAALRTCVKEKSSGVENAWKSEYTEYKLIFHFTLSSASSEVLTVKIA